MLSELNVSQEVAIYLKRELVQSLPLLMRIAIPQLLLLLAHTCRLTTTELMETCTN